MRIKKVLSIVAAVVGALVAFFVTSIIVLMLWATADNRIASSPDRIARHAGFSLPEYEALDYSDNFDRGSSAWSCTEWTLKLKEPVSAELRKKLDRLSSKDDQWLYDASLDAFLYIRSNDGSDDSPEVRIIIYCKTGTVEMYYTWWDFLS